MTVVGLPRLVFSRYLFVCVVEVGDDIKPHDVDPVGHYVHLRHDKEPELENPSCNKGGKKIILAVNDL